MMKNQTPIAMSNPLSDLIGAIGDGIELGIKIIVLVLIIGVLLIVLSAFH